MNKITKKILRGYETDLKFFLVIFLPIMILYT